MKYIQRSNDIEYEPEQFPGPVYLDAESLYYSLVGTLTLIALLTKYASLPVIGLLSRARESVADRTAVTVTGSPAVLASALRTLDERIAETPTEDLREASGPSSLSILPLTPVSSDSDEGETIDPLGMVGALLIIGAREKGVLGDIGESLLSDNRESGRVTTAITETKVRYPVARSKSNHQTERPGLNLDSISRVGETMERFLIEMAEPADRSA